MLPGFSFCKERVQWKWCKVKQSDAIHGVRMKIYTGTGDGGNTSLFSGERLGKNDIRVEAYGTVDELSSYVGVIVAQLPDCVEKEMVIGKLLLIQSDLFIVGAVLATSPGSEDAGLLKSLEKDRIVWLEQQIDEMQKSLDDLHSFILPGGHSAAAWAQVARTICRRSERCIVSLVSSNGCINNELVLGYMNRLSDFFFVLARYINKLADVEEITWHG